MLFIVLRVHELGRQRKIPVYVSFIDLLKLYDAVDRALLGEVLTPSGVPTENLTILGNLHEGMRARVRTDDGGHLERYDNTEGLRQDCVLSPLLFNVSAAALHVVLVCFSKDETIVRDLVRLNDAGVVATEEQDPLACLRRAVWGMLYADGAGISSTSAGETATTMTSHHDCRQGSRSHGIGNYSRDVVFTNTRPENPRNTARYPRSRADV